MTPFKAAWHHIRRSPFQSLLAVIVMFFSFFCLNFFIITSSGMANVLNYFETKPEITIFLKDGLDKSIVENLQKELSTYPNIKEIKFISKDKALGIYKEQNKNNPMLTEMVTASILPASFEVAVSDPAILQKIAENFSAKRDQVDEIIYQKDVIKTILSWTNFVRKTGIIIVSLSTLVAILIISIIIGMKITNRKDEISISRLLGASRFYVKRPFLIEGLLYGVWGSLLGSFVCFSLVAYFYRQINSFFNPIHFVNTDLSFYAILFTFSLFSGMLIGYIASWVGVKRYIRF